MTKTDLENAVELRKKAEVLFDHDTIVSTITRIASEMNAALSEKNPVFLCVMNGAVVFMGQLMTQLNFPLQIDYVHVTRYQGDIEGREIHWVAEPNIPLANRTVVIIEDILDGGLTMSAVIEFCNEHGAKEIFTAALVNKERAREVGGVDRCDFVGLSVDDKFIIGYGLDYKGYLRNEPEILVVNSD